MIMAYVAIDWGEGRITPPTSDLSQHLKNKCRYRRKTCGTLYSINLALSREISGKSVEYVLRKWSFSDAMSHDFVSKKGKLSMLLECRVLKQNASRNHQNMPN